MSSYFDQANRDIRSVADGEPGFLDNLEAVEGRVVRDVNLVTGDREFPDDLRERIQGLIAVHWVGGPVWNHRARERALRSGYSELVEELHSAFHDVARRRHLTRFGVLSDSPPQILLSRDEHDGGS